MKYILWGIAASLAIGFFFQNCKKAVEVAESSGAVVTQKIDLAQENTSSVVIYFNKEVAETRAGQTYTLLSRYTLSTDLQSGIITETSDASAAPKNYCLTSSLKKELNDIIRASQICKFHHNPDPNVMCTMAMIPPYADIVTPRETFNLGAANNGCATDWSDLCDEQPKALKSFIDRLKTQYPSLTCPN